MHKCAPFSNKLFAIVIEGEYLVSFVLDLNANPRIAIFLDETVPKKVSINEYIEISKDYSTEKSSFTGQFLKDILSSPKMKKTTRKKLINGWQKAIKRA